MNAEKQKVLIIGLGYFGEELLRVLSTDWAPVVVDIKESRTARWQEEIPGVEYIHGAGDSPLTWKKLDLTEIKHIISAIIRTPCWCKISVT